MSVQNTVNKVYGFSRTIVGLNKGKLDNEMYPIKHELHPVNCDEFFYRLNVLDSYIKFAFCEFMREPVAFQTEFVISSVNNR